MTPRQTDVPAYAQFGGSIGRTFAGSEGWWPDRPIPPNGAPNVIVMLADDLGFADLGCFGSEIETPNLDGLAANGLRYTNFHSTPMCSPSRASLLTGVNHHLAGFGTVAHADPGFPGYAMELPTNTVTMAEVLRDVGYATMMVGKWHLAKDSDCSASGPQHSWPCQRGFENFYGFLDAFTNLHEPHRLTHDNHAIEVDEYPDGYYLTDDLTDRAISMIRERKASNPEQPFLLYFAHGAVHAPLHAVADDIERYRGRYDQGWDELRRARHARQIEIGVMPPGTPLPDRNSELNHDVRPWVELTEKERELFARHMEVYASMVDRIDQNVGRLTDALASIGELDNTIILFTSDNGASREGEEVGTSSYYVHLLNGDDLEADRARMPLLGGPQTTPHYPRGWAMASNTPFRLYKINTHAGGHRVPAIVSWPAGMRDGRMAGASEIRDQYVHLTDVLPTLAELIGIALPTERLGQPLLPRSGTSFAPTMLDPGSASTHRSTVEEMNGHRSYYEDGWEIVTLHQPLSPFDDDEWELYDLTNDPLELNDLSAAEPERLASMIDKWEREAWANQIYPLDEGSSIKYLIRPSRSEVYRSKVTIAANTPTLERWRSVQLIWFRSVTIRASIRFEPGDQGVLVSHGDQGGGYMIYVLDDHAWFVHNNGRGRLISCDAGLLEPGTQHVSAHLKAVGGGTWSLTMEVDEVERAHLDDVPLLYGMAPFEGITVGRDPRSPVHWGLRERFGSFAYSGSLSSVSYTPGDDAPDSPDNLLEMIQTMGRAFE
ncbi:MAG: arylsulfatase [Actinomycetes bacterium]